MPVHLVGVAKTDPRAVEHAAAEIKHAPERFFDEDGAIKRGPMFELLGSMADADIEALIFIVMMELAKSAREDLKAIMDGVKAINEEKQRWRDVNESLHAMAAALRDRGDERAIDCDLVPCAPIETLRVQPIGAAVLDKDRLLFNAPGRGGVKVPGGLAIAAAEGARGIHLRDLETAKDAVRNKLDSLSEMGEMESLRLQMAMDRLSKMMSTISNLMKKLSDTAQSITQNLK
jgi:hypothetical protein